MAEGRSAPRPLPVAMAAAPPTMATPRTPRPPVRPAHPANRICPIPASPRSPWRHWRSTPGHATGAWCSSPIHILCTNKNRVWGRGDALIAIVLRWQFTPGCGCVCPNVLVTHFAGCALWAYWLFSPFFPPVLSVFSPLFFL